MYIPLKDNLSPSEKIAKLVEQAKALIFSNTPISYDLLGEAYEISLEILPRKEQIDVLFLYAYTKSLLGMHDKELKDLIECKEYALSINDDKLYTRIMGNMASIFLKLKLHHQAIFIFKELIKNQDFQADRKMYYKHQNNLIYNYQISHNSNENLKSKIKEILDFCKENNNQDIDLYNMAHINMALYYKYKNKYEKAIFHFLKVLDNNKEEEFCIQNYELYIDIALVYNQMNEPKKEFIYMSKALKISKKYKLEKLNKILYEQLASYYKNVSKYDKALKYFEKFRVYQLKEEQELVNINKIIKALKFKEQEGAYKKLISDYIETNLFTSESSIIIVKDITGSSIKLIVENIISVNVNEDMLSIFLTDNRVIKVNQKFNEFTENLINSSNNNHLFFYTNKRSELVNLYWISKVDKLKKTVYLNVLSKEFCFKLTRGQFQVLKDFLKI